MVNLPQSLAKISEGIKEAGDSLILPRDTLPFTARMAVDVTKESTMARPRRLLPRAFTSLTRGQRRAVTILLVVLIFGLVKYLQTPAKSYRNELDADPHFTYLAPFRKNPNHAYEAAIEEALHK